MSIRLLPQRLIRMPYSCLPAAADSMFVLLPGRSREEAFRIGAEMASAVTAANPPPVTLKMEKVYHPCVLLSKKRYVGFAYESPTQVLTGGTGTVVLALLLPQCLVCFTSPLSLAQGH
jgi:DNA polymerase elongation subunit (family B)